MCVCVCVCVCVYVCLRMCDYVCKLRCFSRTKVLCVLILQTCEIFPANTPQQYCLFDKERQSIKRSEANDFY